MKNLPAKNRELGNLIKAAIRMMLLTSKLIIAVAILLLDEVFEIFSHHAFMEI